jgi:hypothetical protein
MKSLTLWTGAVLALALAGCADPEAECRKGVDELREKVNGLIATGQHKEMGDPVVKAHNELDMAYTEMVAGNYPGCLDFVGQARVTLKSGLRTNQQ